MQPKKKRVKRYADGFYYPEYKGLFFWRAYKDKQFRDIRFAHNFLDKQHAIELAALKRAASVEVFEWKPKA